jgi:SnoaL-like domain
MPTSPNTMPGVDDAARRAAIIRNLRSDDAEAAHDMYHEDAILEFPQSGERFIGLRQFKEWREQYPAKVDYRIRRLTGSGELWVNELLVSYNGSPWTFGVSIIRFRGDRIARETIYVADGWDAAEWRAPWATRFDPQASVPVDDWQDGVTFGLEAELDETLRDR